MTRLHGRTNECLKANPSMSNGSGEAGRLICRSLCSGSAAMLPSHRKRGRSSICSWKNGRPGARENPQRRRRARRQADGNEPSALEPKLNQASWLAGLEAEGTMRFIRSLGEYLHRWIVRYKAALDYVDAGDRRPTEEIEWNGEMIGDLRRRSSDV